MYERRIQVIVVAAGKGTRIAELTENRPDGTQINKCALPIGPDAKSLVRHPVEAVIEMGFIPVIVVVKHLRDSVEAALADLPVVFVEQGDQKGTAKAVEAGIGKVEAITDDVLILYGDSSLFIDETVIKDMLDFHYQNGVDITCLSVEVTDPTNLGRILRNNEEAFVGIVEEKDATPEQRTIPEINTGAALYSASVLRKLLPKIEENPLKHEYYLTDIIALALKHGYRVESYKSNDARVGIGINSKADYEQASQLLVR